MKHLMRAALLAVAATAMSAEILAGPTEDFLAAANRRDWQKLESSLQKGADVDAKRYGMTMLMAAAAGGDLDLVKYLVSKGASLSLTDSAGRTSLQRAQMTGQQAVVSYLKSVGAQ